jgi:hypothetical protein
VSRVGRDERGEAARRMAGRHGVDTGLLQTDAALPTGWARVRLDDGGVRNTDRRPGTEAAPTPSRPRSRRTRWWRTLAQRDPGVCGARLIGAARCHVYDANLRAPHVVLMSLVRSRPISPNH